ncbi:MAG: dihydroxyacetone kinase subunit L [Tissierellia bacterium]|nr:dihydroxyacetone kinase subunit L [Tissierellia bacterium]
MEYIYIEDVKGIFKKISEIMNENKDYLISLDGAMGDGDLGITMSEGFGAIVEEMDNFKEEDIGNFIAKMGMTMANAAPSTLGTLLATAMMKGGRAIKGKSKLKLDDMVCFGEIAIDGMKAIGKAEIGDKTILDSLWPGIENLKENEDKDITIVKAYKEAYEAAEEGALNTKHMISKHGRAAYYGEDSIGKQDPGATAGALIFKGIYLYFEER